MCTEPNILSERERERMGETVDGGECSNLLDHPALLTQACSIINGTYFNTLLNNKEVRDSAWHPSYQTMRLFQESLHLSCGDGGRFIYRAAFKQLFD